jgi:hypothetical protein
MTRRSVFPIRLLALLAVLVAGCSASRYSDPVDPERARETLNTVLEGWKKGDSPTVLKDGTPSISVQDADWLAGAKLVDYQLTSEGKAVASNLRVPVILTIRSKQGKDVKKNVNYIVGTSPVLTIFRDFR